MARSKRSRLFAAAAVTVGLTLGGAVATAAPASASVNNCGIATCSLYLSREQTRSAVYPATAAGIIGGALPGWWRLSGIAPGLIAAKASEAAGKNQCLRIRYSWAYVGGYWLPVIVGLYSDGSSWCRDR